LNAPVVLLSKHYIIHRKVLHQRIQNIK